MVKKIRVIIDRLDSKIEIEEYEKLVETLFYLTKQYSNFGMWIIPSNENGVFINYEIFDNTYIFNEDVIKFGDFDITYESICRNYPDNKLPKKEEVLKALLQLFPFHKPENKYLATRETIIMSIFLELIGVDAEIGVRASHLSKLEHNFFN